MIGKSLAHYEVIELIGKGGMGEVYRARDTKLERDVALKVLPSEMAHDPERIARFEREARTLATLQHPNVASIYGFEEDSGTRFLVMELVAGEDLTERIKRGPLGVEETIEIARQIAEGLEAAHERAIVHRDLKPANIKIDPEGVVKILDFGLARAYASDSDSKEDIENSPTITAMMTQAGAILGTAAYMSPEQAKGKSIDKRADIWAFGVILYEMFSGTRLFQAETVSETIASVLLRDIDWSALPHDTPPSLQALLVRCLQKDSKLRLRDIGEARIVCADPNASVALRITAAELGYGQAKRQRVWPWAVAVLIALVVGVAAGQQLHQQATYPAAPALQFDIPDDSNSLLIGSLALSPDGEHLIFTRRDSLGGQELWIRRLDEDDSRPLPGTRGAQYPFCSADGKSFGFFINNDLYRAKLDGSGISRIAMIPQEPRGGSWSQYDLILVGTDTGPIFRVPANGGAVETVTEVVKGVEDNHCWPMFLPDGKHFVFLADASSDEGHRLYLQSLDGRVKKILEKAIRSEIFVDFGGALLWCQNNQLYARSFDFSRRRFTGSQTLLQSEIQPFGNNHECALALSTNGILAFQRGNSQSVIDQMPLDGSPSKQLLLPDNYRNPRLSPDGKMLAFEITSSAQERLIWVRDLVRGTRTLASERGKLADSPAWSADGQDLYFDSSVSGTWKVYRKRVFEGSPPELLGGPEGTDDIATMDCSSDGKWLLVNGSAGSTGRILYLGALEGDKLSWSPWLTSSAGYSFGRFSPNSRWIAFESSTSGQLEVYVAPVEGGPSVKRITVSVRGGSDPAWSRDGSKLYYRSPQGILMESTVSEQGNTIEFSPPVQRIELLSPRVSYLRNAYDTAPDGTSVIAFVATEEAPPAIRVRTGWRTW